MARHGESQSIHESVYHADVDMNVVSYATYNANGRSRLEQTWEYARQDGIIVPSRFVRRRFDTGADEPTYYREHRFHEVVLNEPIDAEQFQYRGLGVREGDRFVDRIEGREYVLNAQLEKIPWEMAMDLEQMQRRVIPQAPSARRQGAAEVATAADLPPTDPTPGTNATVAGNAGVDVISHAPASATDVGAPHRLLPPWLAVGVVGIACLGVIAWLLLRLRPDIAD